MRFYFTVPEHEKIRKSLISNLFRLGIKLILYISRKKFRRRFIHTRNWIGNLIHKFETRLLTENFRHFPSVNHRCFVGIPPPCKSLLLIFSCFEMVRWLRCGKFDLIYKLTLTFINKCCFQNTETMR